jgi:hypothetical protein
VAYPNLQSVNEILYNMGRLLRDSRLVTADGGSGFTFTAAGAGGLAGGKDNRYANSEMVLWRAARGPYYIASSTASTGTVTVGGSGFASTVTLGTQGVIQNFNGRGYPEEMKQFALQMALTEYPGVTDAVVSIASPSTTDYWNAIPASLRSVYRVTFLDGTTGLEDEIAPSSWRNIDISGRRINLPFDWGGGQTVRLWGRADLPMFWSTSDYTTPLNVNAADLIKEALPWLLMGQRDEKASEITQNMYNDRMRNRRDMPRANEVFLV